MKLLFRNHFGLFILIVLSLIAYSNTLYSDYHFDDIRVILEDGIIKNFDNFLHTDMWLTVNWRPFALFTFALNYQAHGIDVFGYHVVNIAVHILTMVLVYIFTAQVFKISNLKSSSITLLIPALVFALHPIQTQSVTYIVQRMTSLSVLFYIGALVSYIEMRLAAEKNLLAKTSAFALFTGICILLSILSKQIGLSVFIVFMAAEAFLLSRNGNKTAIVFSLLYATVIFGGIVYVTVQGLLPQAYSGISRCDYFVSQLHVLPSYFGLMLTGIGQNIDHFIRPVHTFGLGAIFGSVIYLFSLLVLVLPVNRIVKFASLFFVATMLVESSFIPIADVFVEHRMYLTIIPLSLVLAYLYSIFQDKGTIRYHYLSVGVFAVLLTGATWSRNTVWKTPVSLWTDSCDKNSANPRALNNLGQALMEEERFVEAIPLLHKALGQDPQRLYLLTNIAVSYSFVQNWKYSDFYIKLVADKAPHSAESIFLRGLYCHLRGNNDTAITLFKSAIAHDARHFQSRQFLIEALRAKGDFTDENAQKDELLRLYPEYYRVLNRDYLK